MKRYGCLILLVLSIACNKEDDFVGEEIQLTTRNIVGIWQLEAAMVSNGGAAEWESIKNGNRFGFEIDGTYIFENRGEASFSDSGSYTLEENLLILVPNAQNETERPKIKYSVTLGRRKMILTPAGPFCVEQCLYRYSRLN